MISVFDYGAGNLRSVQNTLGAIENLRAAGKTMNQPGSGDCFQIIENAIADMEKDGKRMALSRGTTPSDAVLIRQKN